MVVMVEEAGDDAGEGSSARAGGVVYVLHPIGAVGGWGGVGIVPGWFNDDEAETGCRILDVLVSRRLECDRCGDFAKTIKRSGSRNNRRSFCYTRLARDPVSSGIRAGSEA